MRNLFCRASAALVVALPLAGALAAPAPLAPRSGWAIKPTDYRFAQLSDRLDKAIADAKMNLVNSASASQGAKAQGIVIAGNRVVGVFRNDFARRMLTASIPAGIEAPVRFYLTEGADGRATLSYRTPSDVFAPYLTEGGAPLRDLARELDAIFAAIAAQATAP
ncbi:MAG: DUF302 domain-containing protein [Rhodoblastus sp.]|nr:DUF302 domain-containing protein [Rhodoblastus sp.]